MKKSGRKNVWSTIIEPNLPRIKQWLEEGLTEKQICENLQIGVSTWWKYKQERPDFVKEITNGRVRAVSTIEDSMFQSACGFERKVKKAMKLKDVEYENGRKVRETERIEYYEEIEYFKPDTTAGIFLMTNWAKNQYARDAATLELKKRELKLKEEQGGW